MSVYFYFFRKNLPLLSLKFKGGSRWNNFMNNKLLIDINFKFAILNFKIVPTFGRNFW